MTRASPSALALRQLDFFAGMPDEHLALVARVARPRRFRAGQVVIQENSAADTFFIVRSGRVRITKLVETGEELPLDVVGKGGFFGEMALLDEGPRSATARAVEPTRLLEISRSDFKVLLDQAPLLAYAMMRVLSMRLRGTGAQMVAELQRKNQELKMAYRDTLNAMVNTLEAKDRYTHGHTERVTTIAKAIAGRIGLSGEELYIIEMGALLHDVGKIGVKDEILRKDGPLDSEQREDIQEHPAKGGHILSNIAYLKGAIPCVLHHHERYDGGGYPEHLAGADIPLPGRIIAVADAFDAMTTDRPYRKAMSYPRALAELRQEAGRQFDPKVVRAFLDVWRRSGLAAQLKRGTEGSRRRLSKPLRNAG
jgi:HD-GYP domain-containing protein (c-di-GMP phosphodiesterase class II)